MVRPFLVVLAGTLLGGCSSTFFLLTDGSTSPDAGPANYQVLVANDLNNLQKRGSMGSFEISPLRQTQLAQPGDWFACVRTNVQDRPTHIAVFLRDGKVIDRRQAVLIDGCAQEQFQPLPKVVEAPPKADEAKSKAGVATAGQTEGSPARQVEESPSRQVEDSPSRWVDQPPPHLEELRRQ